MGRKRYDRQGRKGKQRSYKLETDKWVKWRCVVMTSPPLASGRSTLVRSKLDLASDSPEREDFTQLVGSPGST